MSLDLLNSYLIIKMKSFLKLHEIFVKINLVMLNIIKYFQYISYACKMTFVI